MSAVRNGSLAVAILAASATAIPMIVKWEGWENKSYPDVTGKWTACAGETQGVRPGQIYTNADCETKLARRVVEFGTAIAPCLPPQTPHEVRAAFIVTSWNIGYGPAGFCGSSMSRLALAGDFKGACASLDKWNKAKVGGGKAVAVLGLTLRRSDERQLCEAGLLR